MSRPEVQVKRHEGSRASRESQAPSLDAYAPEQNPFRKLEIGRPVPAAVTRDCSAGLVTVPRQETHIVIHRDISPILATHILVHHKCNPGTHRALYFLTGMSLPDTQRFMCAQHLHDPFDLPDPSEKQPNIQWQL